MRSKLFYLIPALGLLMAGCSDDKAAWEQLPSGPITGADAMLTFNGDRSYGRVILDAESADRGELELDNVIPGYPSVDMDVTLKEMPDGTLAVEGKKSLKDAPEIMPSTRSDTPPFVIYDLKVSGVITTQGKARIDVVSQLTQQASGNLVGAWVPKVMLPVSAEMMKNSPVVVNIALRGNAAESASLSADMSMLAGALLTQAVGSIDFRADGNFIIGYPATVDLARALTDGIDLATGQFKALRPMSLTTGKNLVFWYKMGEMVCFTPYIPNITYQIAVDAGQNPNLNDGATQEKLEKMIAEIAAMGVDTKKMLALFDRLNDHGIPFGAGASSSDLTIVITKKMLDPVMELIAPALPELDSKLAAFLADEKNAELAALLTEKIFPRLGVKNLQEFATLWATQIEDFTITLNFSKL